MHYNQHLYIIQLSTGYEGKIGYLLDSKKQQNTVLVYWNAAYFEQLIVQLPIVISFKFRIVFSDNLSRIIEMIK